MQGLRIGSFVLSAPLATGGMGAVWRAVHASGVPAALKIIPADAEAQMFEAAVGLQAEIRAVGALDHPNIVRVYDAGTLGPEHEAASGGKLRAGSPWLAMELADGPIDGLQEGMDWSRLSNVLLQVLDGLAHAHARGMVHRDLKPANVLYTRGASGLRVLLADFGLAWRFERGGTPAHAGSLPYASPEQLLAQKSELGPWTDLYGLGCVAYRLATGRRPFRGKDVDAVRRAHLFGERPPLRPRFPVSEGFEAWVHGMIAKEPRARFQRAADAAWALLRLPSPKAAPREEIDEEGDVPSVTLGTRILDRTTTLPLSQWRVLDERSEPVDTSAPAVRSPTPADWRRPSDGRAAPLEGRGLGLFGLQEPPMVGRVDERNRLWEELTRRSAFRLVVLRGSAGVGKTRLASWLCERGHEVGVAEVFRATFRQSPGSGETEGLGGLVEEHLRIQGLAGAELLRELRITLRAEGLRDGEEATRLARLLRPTDPTFGGGLLPAEERFAAVTGVIARRTAGRRALVWLEDAFWSSEGVAFADHLARHLGSPALVLLTVRDDLVAAAVVRRARAVVETHGGAELRIGPLRAGEVAELVAALIPARGDLPERIEHGAQGHPATAVRLIADLVRGGHLKGDAGGVWLRTLDVLPLPDAPRWKTAIGALAAERPELARALRVAAALGSHVVYAEWRDACRLLGVPLPQTEVTHVVERGFLVGERPSAHRWTFAHESLREVLASEAAAEGPAVELACAEALASRGGAVAGRAAAHFEAAGQQDRAIDTWAEALAWLVDWDRARALDVAERWRAAIDRASPSDPRRAIGLGLLVDLRTFEGGEALVAAVGELSRLAKVDRGAELRVWIEQARLDLAEGALPRATARAELAFARSRGTPLRARAVVLRADVRAASGDAEGAVAFLESWLAELDAEDQEVVLARARLSAAAGRPGEGLAVLGAFVDRQTRAQAPMARARVQHARGLLLSALGRAREALAALEEAEAMRARAGHPWPPLEQALAAARTAAGTRSSSPPLDGRARSE